MDKAIFTQCKRITPAEWVQQDIGGLVGIDFETFYSADYSVADLGNWAYVTDPRFDAYAVSVSNGIHTCVCHPKEFPWATLAGREWVSHNREFDMHVWGRLVNDGTVPAAAKPIWWFCSAALCAYLQLPRALAGAAEAVFGVTLDKGVRDRAKGKDRSDDLFGMSEDMQAYSALDAEMTRALWLELQHLWPEHERKLFELTCEMGVRGVCVDQDYLAEATKELTELNASLELAIPWKPTLSIKKFEEACEQVGTPLPESTAASDPEFQVWASYHQNSEAVTWARHMQRYRSSNRTLKVLESMKRRVKPDGRMAYELKYYGAAPGRWSGGGGLNTQNFNRAATDEGVDLRKCIVPPAGHKLVVADYSQIESRVLLFLAGDMHTLGMFAADPAADAYEIHARATMGYDEPEPLKDFCARTGSKLRQLAKARVLGLGFGCGPKKFVLVAKTMAGLDLGYAESVRIVKEFRDSNPLIIQLWDELANACRERVGGNYFLPFPCAQVNPKLGRMLAYRDIEERDGELSAVVAGERTKVYGGLLAENWTQGTARDVLASAWLRCVAEGYEPVLSVHDELVFEVPEATAEEDLAHIVRIMEQPVAWAPGLPLKVDAKLAEVYGK
jgi:hypothetical protein